MVRGIAKGYLQTVPNYFLEFNAQTNFMQKPVPHFFLLLICVKPSLIKRVLGCNGVLVRHKTSQYMY